MIGPLLDPDRQKEASSLLNSWANCFLTLEKKYYIKRNEVTNRDYDFLRLIGQSVYLLNSFNSLIIASIEHFGRNLSDKVAKSELSQLSDFMRFFNSLIASKIKFFFFRETPIKNTNSPFLQIDLEIVKSANELVKEVSALSTNITRIKLITAKYFFLQTILYSFIYDYSKEKGVFLRFAYNKATFSALSNTFNKLFYQVNSESELRFLGSSLISILVDYYIKEWEGLPQDSLNIKKPDCYSNLFLLLSEKPDLKIEPLTCHLGDIFWKLDGMIHDNDEFQKSMSKDKHDFEIIDDIKNFTSSYLSKVRKMYQKDAINYSELFECESSFIQNLYRKVLKQKDLTEVKDTFIKVDRKIKTFQKIPIKLNRTTEDKDKLSLVDIVDKIRSKGEHGFKIESLLETLDLDELLALLFNYSKMIMTNQLHDKFTEFVGFYKSGVFLGHMINLINETDNPVWLFKVKPYVATHPIHKDILNNDFHTIVLFDECVKTGFTYSLYESYLARNLYGAHLSTYLYSLFDFSYYKRIQFAREVNFTSLIKLNKNYLPENIDELDFRDRMFEYGKRNEFFCRKIESDDLIKIITYDNQNAKRIDLTYLLTNTEAVISICHIFSDKIIEENMEKRRVALYSPSDDGEVLLLITALLLKMKSNIPISFACNDKFHDDSFSVAIDLSFITGFSLAYSCAIHRNGNYRAIDYEKMIQSFDIVLTIYGSRSSFKNIFALSFVD